METRLLIRGELVEGAGAPLAVENPATEETVADLRGPSPEQLDAAIAAAREAARGWASTPAVERAELLHEVATRMRAMTDELARTMTLEGGKPLIENSDEVGWTAAAFDYYAEMGRNFAGRVIPSIEATQLALVVKEPLGVWGCIVPWNYPLLLLAWKLAPALAAGNTVVAKPSELTPVSTLMLASCFSDLSPGVVNLVAGGGGGGGVRAAGGADELGDGRQGPVHRVRRRGRRRLGGRPRWRVGRVPERGAGVHLGRALLRGARGVRRLPRRVRVARAGAAGGRPARSLDGRGAHGVGEAAGQGVGAGGGRRGGGRFAG